MYADAFFRIEELGLEIRSSREKPRFIKGDWNPKVKQDILYRLSEICINELESINWIDRGIPSDLYNEIKPKIGINSDWNDGKTIHDRKMRIYNAIHYTSYIKNFFIGHKFNEIVRNFTPYDARNIQMLARRLILGKLNLWKEFNKD
ncbi:hypothetical protein ACH0BF_13580 [Pseudobacillus sp. 179-B 2D1 NHS]|uniref:hypothetical protein n=1 Tax=Pseudobacillus sp. 179-B 2D1 NHS TaxID=3374292 RepID=UPI003879D28A